MVLVLPAARECGRRMDGWMDVASSGAGRGRNPEVFAAICLYGQAERPRHALPLSNFRCNCALRRPRCLEDTFLSAAASTTLLLPSPSSSSPSVRDSEGGVLSVNLGISPCEER